MQVTTRPSILVHFSDLVDPRGDRTKLHPLRSVVAIALCGVICGADSWVEVAEFGESRRDWLAEWLDLSVGIPSHDTFGRVFAALDPVGFETCFAGWVGAVAEATGGQVVAQGADYVLALKANQGTLYQAVVAAFAERSMGARLPYRHDTHREVDKGHGRVEVRTTTLIDDPALLAWLNPYGTWAGLTGVARVEAARRLGGTSSGETRYYPTSLSAARLVHDAVRSHWGIENSVHWVLDMAFREDLSRVRVGQGAHTFSLLRRRSLNLLRQDRTARCGIKGRRLKAALNPAYLLATLTGSL